MSCESQEPATLTKEYLEEFILTTNPVEVRRIIRVIRQLLKQECINQVDIFSFSLKKRGRNKGITINDIEKFFQVDMSQTHQGVIEKTATAVQEVCVSPSFTKEPRVYVPPDLLTPGTSISIKKNDVKNVPPVFIPRLKYLEEVLESLGIDMFLDCEVWIGRNTPQMMRILSYMIVIIPPQKVIKLIKSKEGVEIDEAEVKERMVLLCDEHGNRTFIIDKTGAEVDYPKNHQSTNTEFPTQEFHFYTDKTKSQLKSLLNIVDLIWFEQSEVWKKKIQNLLTLKKIQTPPTGGAPTGGAPTPNISLNEYTERQTKESDVMKGAKDLARANEAGEIFDKEGNKYLHKFGLMNSIKGLGFYILKEIIEENEIRVIRGKAHNRRNITYYYSVKDIKKHILPSENEKGEIFDEEGNKYLNLRGLQNSIKGLGFYILKKIIKENEIRVIKGKTHSGRKTTYYYSVEDIEEHFYS